MDLALNTEISQWMCKCAEIKKNYIEQNRICTVNSVCVCVCVPTLPIHVVNNNITTLIHIAHKSGSSAKCARKKNKLFDLYVRLCHTIIMITVVSSSLSLSLSPSFFSCLFFCEEFFG